MGFVESGPLLLNPWGCNDLKDDIVIKWRCTAPKSRGFEGRFNKIISCSNEAVMNGGYGWICDCGRWTFGDDEYHKPLKWGTRNIVYGKLLIEEIKKINPKFDVKNIFLVSIKDKKRCLKDKSICNQCGIPGCLGAVRFDDNYFELGYIETNLPMCPHVIYREDMV
jgi:hypothetical protein